MDMYLLVNLIEINTLNITSAMTFFPFPNQLISILVIKCILLQKIQIIDVVPLDET